MNAADDLHQELFGYTPDKRGTAYKKGEEDVFGFADLTFRRYLDEGH